MNKFEAFKNLFFDNTDDDVTVSNTTSTGWTIIPANPDNIEIDIGAEIEKMDDEEVQQLAKRVELEVKKRAKSSEKANDPAPEPTYEAPGRGKSDRPLVAFVGSSPSKVDMIRDRPFAGIIGKTMRETYVAPLGLDEGEVYMTNIVKTFCSDGHGSACEPTEAEVKAALPSFVEEMKHVRPHFIVALGKTASEAIGQIAEEWVPHPRAINIHSDTGEVGRKMSRLAKKIESDPTGTISGEVRKFEEEKQIVYGVVMEPLENDTDRNWTIPEEIEKAAHLFMRDFRLIDAEHTREVIDGYPVESYIAPNDMEIDGKPVKKGSWVMGVKIEDADEWAKVKDGTYTGFSIDASAYIDPTVLLD